MRTFSQPTPSLFRMGETQGEEGWRWGWALVLTVLVHAGAAFAGLSVMRDSRPVAPPPEEPELVFLTAAPARAAVASSSPARMEQAPHRAKPRIKRPAAVLPPVPRPPTEAPVPMEEKPPEPVPEVEVSTVSDAELPESVAGAAGLHEVGGVIGGLVGGVLNGREEGVVGTGEGTALDVKQVARPPAVLKQVKPQYPRQARAEGIEGIVLVRIIIGTDGRVEEENTRVIRSVPALDAAAVSSVNRWRFSPALGRHGRPVRVVIDVPLQFSLK